ncbi:hypothetical protein NLD30_09180 [SCandidatus Aminicenantes bacterium Aminicenantia_JdfR_composite]|nr:hypothetical protein [SCandidatus Aminicenantes bacterium Aminicenantia_JdfR_composite]MCP2597260.1 hypothetical protein [Candidatus Aminicenantes bacterium AC-335-G13]
MEIVILDEFMVDVAPDDLIRVLGLKRKDYPKKEEIKEIIQKEISEIKKLIEPKGIYRIIDYEETNRHPIFENAKKIALAICTIGSKLEKRSSELMRENQMLKGLIYDAYGSEAVEQVACQLDSIISEQARKMGFYPSKRFSPGYGKWEIEEQAFIFKILPGEEIGVKLRSSFMMEPRKSISFRINFYNEPVNNGKKSLCAQCKMKNCPFRKEE